MYNLHLCRQEQTTETIGAPSQLKSSTISSPECLFALPQHLKDPALQCQVAFQRAVVHGRHLSPAWCALLNSLTCFSSLLLWHRKAVSCFSHLKSKRLCTLICQLYFPFWAFFVVPFPYLYSTLLISMTFKQNVSLISSSVIFVASIFFYFAVYL